MNRNQKRSWFVAVSLLAIMVLFPPWVYFTEEYSMNCAAGYHLIFSPPVVTGDVFPRIIDNRDRLIVVRIDYAKLILQFMVVLLLTTGLVLLQKERKALISPVVAVVLICVATAGLVFLILFPECHA